MVTKFFCGQERGHVLFFGTPPPHIVQLLVASQNNDPMQIDKT
jgi:hypothetical protein